MAALVEDFSYRADSLEAFESHLNASSSAVPDSATPRTYADGSWETLLEGIGTVSELTLHEAGSKVAALRNVRN